MIETTSREDAKQFLSYHRMMISREAEIQEQEGRQNIQVKDVNISPITQGKVDGHPCVAITVTVTYTPEDR